MKKFLAGAIVAALMTGCNNPGDQTADQTAPPVQTEQAQTTRTDERPEAQALRETNIDDERSAGEDDADAILKAYGDNLAEIEMAQLAQQKSGDEKVRELASTIEEDHENANERLRALGATLNVDLSEDLPDKKEEIHEDLAELSGEEFDRRYVDTQIQLHQKAIEYYETQARTSQDAILANYFEQTVPALRDHLQAARQAAGQ